MCVAGDFSHPLSSEKSTRNQDHQKSHHKSALLKKTDGIINNFNRTESALNNRCEFHNVVTNKVLHHVNEDFQNLNNKRASQDITKSVILCIDQDSLDHKNRKNVISNQKQNALLNNNKFNGYKQHLNDINQLKNELRKQFVITNVAETHADLEIPKSRYDDSLSNGHKSQNEFSPEIRNQIIPTNGNICNINEHSKSLEKVPSRLKRVPKNCSRDIIFDFPESRSKYGSRQNCTSNQNLHGNRNSNELMLRKSHFKDSKLHAKIICNKKIIPNIVINGDSTALCGKMVNTVVDQERFVFGKSIIHECTKYSLLLGSCQLSSIKKIIFTFLSTVKKVLY